MHPSLRTFASLALLTKAVTAFGQSEVFSSPAAAIAAAFQDRKFVEWTSTEGDFNGDGNKDLAIIVSSEEGPQETRLVVLAGVPGGSYSPLSISAQYCGAQKFFGLEAKGSSLYVSEVHKADADGEVTNTLQFRFNKRLADLELIGTENVFESYLDKSYGRESVNYPAGIIISYERIHGRIKETKRSRFAVQPAARLNGFDCNRFFYGTSF